MLRELLRRIKNTVSYGTTVAPVEVIGGVAWVQVQLSAIEVMRLKLAEKRGVAANLPIGTPVVALFVAGDRANGSVVASTSPGNRPTTMTGTEDGSIYGYGFAVRVGADGVHIEGAPDVFVDGNIVCKGQITAQGEVTAKFGTSGSVTLSGHKAHLGGGPPTPGT